MKLQCPECGRAFVKANGLGAHRRRVHGVAGTSRKPALAEVETTLDRDLLLSAVFAGGRIPARSAVLTEVGDWLDAAERLAENVRG